MCASKHVSLRLCEGIRYRVGSTFRKERVWGGIDNTYDDRGHGGPCLAVQGHRKRAEHRTFHVIKIHMANTTQEYAAVIDQCRQLFSKKAQDYGTAWRILRLPSLTDQIFIKANRLRSIQMLGTQKVEDPMEGEFIGIVNYSIMALIQMEKGIANEPDLTPKQALEAYNEQASRIQSLMEAKNHDYGEAWRDMRISSLTDLILQKLLRIKQIEDNQGQTLVSEGIDANYQDMVNYAAFALIKLQYSA
jgi:hypothetical protein